MYFMLIHNSFCYLLFMVFVMPNLPFFMYVGVNQSFVGILMAFG